MDKFCLPKGKTMSDAAYIADAVASAEAFLREMDAEDKT